MSIASEIQALNTNLTSAKNAVTAKGGTVGDTGLSGLADEIATIPSGTPVNTLTIDSYPQTEVFTSLQTSGRVTFYTDSGKQTSFSTIPSNYKYLIMHCNKLDNWTGGSSNRKGLGLAFLADYTNTQGGYDQYPLSLMICGPDVIIPLNQTKTETGDKHVTSISFSSQNTNASNAYSSYFSNGGTYQLFLSETPYLEWVDK